MKEKTSITCPHCNNVVLINLEIKMDTVSSVVKDKIDTIRNKVSNND